MSVYPLNKTAAAGPLYGAFPAGLSLTKNGSGLSPVLIFLCFRASIKTPMILFEIKFPGADFTALRLALIIPGIIAISGLLILFLNGDIEYETA